MKNKFLRLFLLIVMTFLTLNVFAQFGQETIEARINIIRQKFNIANAATNYEVISVDTCRFFLQNDTIKKMVKRIGEDELYEFYVDYKKEQYQPYFIFHQYQTEEKTWQNRYYFHEGSLIKWIDNNKEVVDVESMDFYIGMKEAQGVFEQIMIEWHNDQLNISPEIWAEKKRIDEKVAAIERILQDTALFERKVEVFDEEGSPISTKTTFYQNQEKIAEKIKYTDSHTGENTDVYFANGQPIFKFFSSGSWHFHLYKEWQGTIDDLTRTAFYYRVGEVFFCINRWEYIEGFQKGGYFHIYTGPKYSFDDCY